MVDIAEMLVSTLIIVVCVYILLLLFNMRFRPTFEEYNDISVEALRFNNQCGKHAGKQQFNDSSGLKYPKKIKK